MISIFVCVASKFQSHKSLTNSSDFSSACDATTLHDDVFVVVVLEKFDFWFCLLINKNVSLSRSDKSNGIIRPLSEPWTFYLVFERFLLFDETKTKSFIFGDLFFFEKVSKAILFVCDLFDFTLYTASARNLKINLM